MDILPPIIGSLYVSVSGHDKGRIYVLTEVLDPLYVFVSDGVVRKLDNQKKKRLKHLKLVEKDNSLVKDIIDKTINNEEIRKLIKRHSK